jgi:hypothetical protein
MGAGGKARYIEALAVATEALGIPVDPRDRATDLLGHRHQIAVRLQHIDEVEHGEMGAGIDKQLGRKSVILGHSAAPGAAVNEHIDRCVRSVGCPQIEGLDRA